MSWHTGPIPSPLVIALRHCTMSSYCCWTSGSSSERPSSPSSSESTPGEGKGASVKRNRSPGSIGTAWPVPSSTATGQRAYWKSIWSASFSASSRLASKWKAVSVSL